MWATRTVLALSLCPLPDEFVALIRLIALLMVLLADDGHRIVATDRDGDGTTAVLVASEEGKARMIVVIRVPGFDPRVRVGSDAVELDVSSIGKVGTVDLGKDTTVFIAGALGLVEGDLIFQDEQFTLLVRADGAVLGRAGAVMTTVVLDGLVSHVDDAGHSGRVTLRGTTLFFSGGKGCEGSKSKGKELHD